MESQLQQPEYVDTTSPEGMTVLEPSPLTKLSSGVQSDAQWQRIGAQASDFFAQLPDYLVKIFNDNRQLITTLALFVAALISVKVVLAVLSALNSIPLLSPTFELVGIGYSVWFVNRYLLKASSRQDLSQEIQTLKQQVVGSQQLPE